MGIGRLSDLAIAAHLDGKPANPRKWRGERRARLKPPGISAGGSGNFALIAAVLDLVTGHSEPTDPPEWRDPRKWLTVWYDDVMRRAHDGYEALSPVYGDVHLVAAMLSADCGIPGAREHLVRTLALYSAHMLHGIVAPGTRAKRPNNVALDQWARSQLGLHVPSRPKPQRPLRLARQLRLSLPRQRDELRAALGTVRLAPGELRIRRYEYGHVSYFPSGPRCYAYPQPAVIGAAGREPIYVRPPYSWRRGKAPGPCSVYVDDVDRTLTAFAGDKWQRQYQLAGLGGLVEEIIVPAAASTV